MSLVEFLKKNKVGTIEKEVVISERIKDDEGNPVKFRIKNIHPKEFNGIYEKNVVKSKNGKVLKENSYKSGLDLIIEACVEPNFKDVATLDELECVTSYEGVEKLLLPGEINNLVTAITEVNGFDKSLEELKNDVKN